MPAKKRPTALYARRDTAFLAHVARYRVGLYQSLSQVLFEEAGKPIGTIASKLEKRDPPLVRIHHRAIEGGNNFVSVTRDGCRKLGNVPVQRGAKPPSGAALDLAIGVSFFCCLTGTRRYRLERSQMLELFGEDAPPDNVPHIATDEDGLPRVYRVFQPAIETSKAIKRIRELIEAASKNKAIRRWLLQGDYGFAVLAPSESSRKSLEKSLAKSEIAKDYSILLGVGPTSATLRNALRERKSK